MQEVQRDSGLHVVSIANLAGLLRYLEDAPELQTYKPAVEKYRSDYGVL